MSENNAVDAVENDQDSDTRADLRVAIIIFCSLVLMAIHFVSGFTF